MRGITSSQFTGLLEDLWNKSKNWGQFETHLEDRLKQAIKAKSNVTIEALSTLREQMKRLYQAKMSSRRARRTRNCTS